MEKRTVLVIIDPQNCFMDLPDAPLPVPGATGDMERLAALVRLRRGTVIDKIFVSLDTHVVDHISHAKRWVDKDGNHPAPFTVITHQECLQGTWQAANPVDQKWQLEYLRRLTRPHVIWPVHGQKPSWEWDIYEPLLFELSAGREVAFLEKGMHRDTEQFGLFGADVPYPGASETNINLALIDEINSFDRIVFAGEASSHCVMDSVNQFLLNIKKRDAEKVVLLKDCMSPVPGFESVASNWLTEMEQCGVAVIDSIDFLRSTS
jgi:nicotinamidase/pyrazinamidase